MGWVGSDHTKWTHGQLLFAAYQLNRTPVPNTCIAMGVFTGTNSSSRTGLCSCVERRVALLWLRTYTDRADFVIRPATDDDYFVLVDRSLPTEHCTCPLFVLPNCSDDFARRSTCGFWEHTICNARSYVLYWLRRNMTAACISPQRFAVVTSRRNINEISSVFSPNGRPSQNRIDLA